MNHVAPNIFNYQSPKQYLIDCLGAKQKNNSKYSVRAWARDMGLKSHTLLVMLLQGKRPLRVQHSSFLCNGLNLSSDEKLYLQALIQYESAQTIEEKKLLSLWLQELNPGKDFRINEFEKYEYISHWIHSALMAFCEIPEVSGNEKEVLRRLKGKVTASEINSAVERLKQLGLLTESVDGKWACHFDRVSSPNDIPSSGVREYHRKVADLAKDSLEAVSVEEREFQGTCLPIAKSKASLAKEMIRRFRSQLETAMKGEEPEELYQLNIQFFRLTEEPTKGEGKGVDTGKSSSIGG